jgi:hypothetical protein
MEQNVIKTSDGASPRTHDAAKIRTGAGCRIAVVKPAVKRTNDTGRIRMGAGCRIRAARA